jgi:hypothetical protein
MRITMGLSEFNIRTLVTSDLSSRGFVNKTDTFFWGVISIKCKPSEENMTPEICGNREAVTNLTGIVYILLSLALVFAAVVLLILLFSATPVTHFLPITVLYSCAILTCTVAILIFEIRLRHLLMDPSLWGATDSEIHSSLAGVDKTINIPPEAKYQDDGLSSSASSIILWVSLICFIASFGMFILRYRRAIKIKSYIYSNPDLSFMRAQSISAIESARKSDGASASATARSNEPSVRSRR